MKADLVIKNGCVVTPEETVRGGVAISDGKFVASGPYYGGRDMDMGPSACLRIGEVRVVVSSYKAQLADQSMFRYVGIEPKEQAILVNKSSVHFRADFELLHLLVRLEPDTILNDVVERPLPGASLLHSCRGFGKCRRKIGQYIAGNAGGSLLVDDDRLGDLDREAV